jgi:Tripartite tricarboxylate transporter family receptor
MAYPFVVILCIRPALAARGVACYNARRFQFNENKWEKLHGLASHRARPDWSRPSGADRVEGQRRGAGLSDNTDMLGGQVQAIFDNMPSIIRRIRGGALRALGVTTAQRAPQLPDVQAVAETVPGYEASALFGIGAPKNTPKEIIVKLNSEINAIPAEPEMKERLVELGGEPLIQSPEAFGEQIKAETEKWKKVVEFAGLKVE